MVSAKQTEAEAEATAGLKKKDQDSKPQTSPVSTYARLLAAMRVVTDRYRMSAMNSDGVPPTS